MNTNTLWFHLIWKEARQVLPLILALTCFALFVLGINYWIELSGTSTIEMRNYVALVLPWFAILTGIGVLIGQERSSGFWQWSSSVPIPWFPSLVIKLTLTSLLAVGLLALVAAIEWAVGNEIVMEKIGIVKSQNAELLFFAIHGLSVISMAVLLGRNLIASMLVGIFFSVVIFGELTFLVGKFYDPSAGSTYAMAVITLIHSTAVVIELIVLSFVYRWRWYQGQFSTLVMPLARFWPASATKSLVQGWGYDLQSTPNLWVALVWQAARSQMGLRIAAVVLPFVLLIYRRGFYGVWLLNSFEGLLMMCGISGTLLGLSAFQGEQSRQQYRFLADRGISPKSIFWSHILPPLMICILIGGTFEAIRFSVAPTIGPNDPSNYALPADISPSLGPLLTSLAGFGLGQIVILCIPSLTIAVAVSVLVLISAICYTGFLQIFLNMHRFSPREIDWLFRASLFAFAISIVLGHFYISRRWIIQHRPQFARVLMGWVSLSFIGIWLLSGIGVLETPSVPWQGFDLDQAGRTIDDNVATDLRLARQASPTLSRDDSEKLFAIQIQNASLSARYNLTGSDRWRDLDKFRMEYPERVDGFLVGGRELVAQLSALPAGWDNCWSYSTVGLRQQQELSWLISQIKQSCVKIAILAAVLDDKATADAALKLAEPALDQNQSSTMAYLDPSDNPGLYLLDYLSDDELVKIGIDPLLALYREPLNPTEHLTMRASAMRLLADGHYEAIREETCLLLGVDRQQYISANFLDRFMTYWAKESHKRRISQALGIALDVASKQIPNQTDWNIELEHKRAIEKMGRAHYGHDRVYDLIGTAIHYQYQLAAYRRFVNRLERLKKLEAAK